ncbi:MAG: ribonuclease Y [Candidatus Pacebacteria bacterium]|jgi:ribonuclease Y|nr:ribonuclease Y [Candidatus Paceibacterota bacterium]MDD2796810.1 ribonuclease Y [Candidatus Paceibacterota bacterium]MDD3048121.1 ribonuclease Y [Candidatus Paceibacterota bacterium]MDD3510119.1 ribonuclease Y [Candidatus Paceibacterota bacterium]MDD3918652.1 ribonuclease Y [Candidatus Paceibacterota bacterium]
MDELTLVIVSSLLFGLGIVIGYYIRQSIARKRAGSIEAELKKRLEQTKKNAENIILKARERANKIEVTTKSDLEERQKLVIKAEERVFKKEEILEEKEKTIKKDEESLKHKIEKVKEIKTEIEEIKNDCLKELEKIANLKKEQALEKLTKKIEKEYSADLTQRIRKLEQRGIDQYEIKAKEILATAMQSYAISHATEITTSTVAIQNDEIKGRIIGKEGRNIRAFEKVTGVELIVDETPGSVMISCFNPIRREIAKITLEALIKDGRVQPARIEAEYEKAQKLLAKRIKDAGEAAVYEAGVLDLPEKLIKVLGRLEFRTSYGQNVLWHSVEVSLLGAQIASELGLDVNLCKKAGLLHDIGKALDYQVEGSHTDIGAKILEKFDIKEEIISAVKSHHEEYPYESIEAKIIQIADQISGARPGARKDTLENYLKRLGDLEDIALSFQGVEKVYALQGGREVRVFVKTDQINDYEAQKLAKNIASKIQDELRFPGEIKVNVIRETRIIEYAR